MFFKGRLRRSNNQHCLSGWYKTNTQNDRTCWLLCSQTWSCCLDKILCSWTFYTQGDLIPIFPRFQITSILNFQSTAAQGFSQLSNEPYLYFSLYFIFFCKHIEIQLPKHKYREQSSPSTFNVSYRQSKKRNRKFIRSYLFM